MKISVITVCRNSEKTIGHTIESFLSQDYTDKELIIIDGASSDKTPSIISSYAQGAIKCVSEPDKGMYDALNKALNIYSGDAFGVLNSDDTFHAPCSLSRIAAALADCDAVHGHLNFVTSHKTKQIVRRWRGEPKPRRGFKSGWMPAHPTFYIRRELAEKIGKFDLSWDVASDYDWMMRAVEHQHARLQLLDHVLVDMLQGGTSTGGILIQLRHNLEALEARQKRLKAGPIDYAFFAKPARKLKQFL